MYTPITPRILLCPPYPGQRKCRAYRTVFAIVRYITESHYKGLYNSYNNDWIPHIKDPINLATKLQASIAREIDRGIDR